LRGIAQGWDRLIAAARPESLRQRRIEQRELLRNDATSQSIGDVAARWGMWHWSRFSQEYKETFGELPSQTRRRQSPL
jgi:AraC family transcriptional regulator, ethanolamine operon transcriptional activator